MLIERSLGRERCTSIKQDMQNSPCHIDCSMENFDENHRNINRTLR
ncbi:hypothetical protein HMPREF1985_01916 [Mitsuokella sp. oral taxon 131 str. W9106]|nr:hypothetical protein HMPREF1985_01916 [Mitsuokella sp. oral taxon 131 str. W9106]